MLAKGMYMRINSTTPSSVSKLPQTSPQVSFQSVLASKQKTAIADLKNDLKKVSMDLNAGKITKEQASQLFVNLVTEKRNEFNLSASSMKKVQMAVGDLVSQDPVFVSKLQNELKRI